MEFSKLSDIFRGHAVRLAAKSKKDPSAKFRSIHYDRAANIFHEQKSKATKESIMNLEISDYMKNKAVEVVEGKLLKSKNTKRRSRSRDVRRLTSSVERKTKPVDNSEEAKAKLISELSNLMGIGLPRARELVKNGLTNISQLHMKKYRDQLPEETKLFLDLKPGREIPHEHIKLLEPYVFKAGGKYIVGSYRRKKPFSRDIDVMLVSDDAASIDKFIDIFKSQVKVYPYSKGSDKLSMIVDMSDLLGKAGLFYKLDVFRTNAADEIPMLLYSTGSKEFNIVMRNKAKRMGYLLNQKGLFKNGVKVTGLIAESDYFKILNMDYKEPVERK